MRTTVVQDLEQALNFLNLAESSCRCTKAAIGLDNDAAIINCANAIEELRYAAELFRIVRDDLEKSDPGPVHQGFG
jgi:hypothetical protein